MCFYGTTVGVVVGGVVVVGVAVVGIAVVGIAVVGIAVVGLIGGGVRSVLVHCCKKFSIRLRSLPVWLTHSRTDNPCEFLAILAMANPHLLQLRSDPRHLLLTLSKSFAHCVSSSHLPTARPQIVSV